MGRKKGYLDFRKSSKKRRKAKGKEFFLMLFIFILAVLVGTAVFLALKERIRDIPKDDVRGEDLPGSQDVPGQEAGDGQGQEEGESLVAGPYGLWSVPEGQEQVEVEEPKEEVWMADFVDERILVNAKGIYATSDAINRSLGQILELLDDTELNAIVIDIKDDDGRLTYQMSGELIDRFGTARSFLPDIEGLMKVLKEHDVYVIARVVAFKDPLLAKTVPELALHLKDGTVYKDYSRLGWLNPLKQDVLDYYVEIARNIAEAGFNEINFDYVRFPTEGNISEIDLGAENEGLTKIDAITAAVKYLCEQIKPMGIYVSADVFGGVITSAVDQRNVGQSYQMLSTYLDYICPMIYPSHYANGYYGIDYPDTEPYKMMYLALLDSNKVLSAIPENSHKAVVRPWLQDFTASWLKHYIRYGKKEVRDQIEAVYDSGQSQWLLWNAAVNYTKDALMTEEEADYAFANRPVPTPTPAPTPVEPTKMPNVGQYIDSPWKKE